MLSMEDLVFLSACSANTEFVPKVVRLRNALKNTKSSIDQPLIAKLYKISIIR